MISGKPAHRRSVVVVVLLMALLPSAYLAWSARDMPHLGHFHDDGIYLVNAKSLVEGSGYRILSLPDQPFQTKYPPLFPFVLSRIWKINPNFPQNLGLITLLGWMMLPAFVLLAALSLRDLGIDERAIWFLCILLALHPVLILFSFSAMPELMFSCMLLAGLILGERARKFDAGAWSAVTAGLLSSAAYLTRTAALPLLVTAPLALARKRQFWRAALFFLSMAPAVIAWTLWVRAHLSPKSDLVTLYYTDYVRYHLQNVSWYNLPLVVWRNVEGILSGIGGLILVNVGESSLLRAVSRVMAVFAILGLIRLARCRELSQYSLFSIAYLSVLLIWYVPANERFFIPIFPIVLAGLFSEFTWAIRVIRSALQSPYITQRLCAFSASAGMAAAGGVFIYLLVNSLGLSIPALITETRKYLADNRAAYHWISRSLPKNATFLTQNEAVLYLYAGRRGCGLKVPSALHYYRNPKLFADHFREAANFAKQQRFSYILFTATDYYSSKLERSGGAVMRQLVSENHAFRLVYQSRSVAVYRINYNSGP